jgi:hypothetical protein
VKNENHRKYKFGWKEMCLTMLTPQDRITEYYIATLRERIAQSDSENVLDADLDPLEVICASRREGRPTAAVPQRLFPEDRWRFHRWHFVDRRC